MKLLTEEDIHNPKFKIGEYGKAYISNYDDLHFNLSHSGKMVTCALSDDVVGVDVEYNDPKIDLNIAKHYFFNEEYQDIMNSNNSSDTFFNYWVLKESYMKYTGLGFHLNLDSFQIEIKDEIKLKNDKTDLKFNLFDINEYKIGICSKYSVFACLEYEVGDLY
jgi:4'-phosphopantetheinyl transferase